MATDDSLDKGEVYNLAQDDIVHERSSDSKSLGEENDAEQNEDVDTTSRSAPDGENEKREQHDLKGEGDFVTPGPNLYEECMMMWQISSMMFFLSKIRNLARNKELFNDNRNLRNRGKSSSDNLEEFLQDSSEKVYLAEDKQHCCLGQNVKISDIIATMKCSYDIIKEIEGKLDDGSQRIDFHIQIMENIHARCGDDKFEIVYFDDEHQDKEIVAAIIIDHIFKKVIIAFRGSQYNHDWKVNFSGFQRRATNPLFKMKSNKEVLRQSLIGKPKDLGPRLKVQRKKMKMHTGFYGSIFDEESKLGKGSKYDYIMKNTVAVLRKNKGYGITVTGLSLGGALCQIFSLRLAAETSPIIKKPISCFSYAAPKVGSLAFRKAIEVR